MNESPQQLPAGFDEEEWRRLAAHLRDCPGSICAAVVPGPTAGDALFMSLLEALRPLPMRAAPDDLEPAALGALARELGQKDHVLVISLDGRRPFDSDDAAKAFWQNLNFQRERLASGQLRTCFILDPRSDERMILWADDLREWARFFRFPDAMQAALPDALGAGKTSLTRSGIFFGETASPEALRGQWRRARFAGLPAEQLLHEYAAPLFISLITHNEWQEAFHLWNKELGGESVLDKLPPPLKMEVMQARTELAKSAGDLNEYEAWTRRFLEESEKSEEDEIKGIAAAFRGEYFARLGELDKSLDLYRTKALSAFERSGDVRARAVTLGKIADVLQARGQLDEALRTLRDECLPAFEKLGDIRSCAQVQGRIADVLQARGQLDEALRIRREEELPVYEKLGDVRSRAVTLGKIANIMDKQGELEKAIEIYQKEVLPAYERLGDAQLLVVDRSNLAKKLLRRNALGDRKEAKHLLQQALESARAMKLPDANDIEAMLAKLNPRRRR